MLNHLFASCIRCGACAAVCSNNALSVGSIEKVIDGETVTRDRIEFNPYKCDECGDCIEACPYNMLHATGNEKFPIMGFCTLCGQCIEACPKTHYMMHRCINTFSSFFFF